MNINFYTNNSETTFLEKIKYSLGICKKFRFSVSFIKNAGLNLIQHEIIDALNRGVEGKIITSTYQNFTDIASLNFLLGLSNTYSNFQCHIDFNSFGEQGFHTKGYLFEYENSYEVVIGSSNITRYALLKNIEWNLASLSKEDDALIISVDKEFNQLWNKTIILTPKVIKDYRIILDYAIEKWDMDYVQIFSKISPNYMQRKALKELQRYRDMGVNKALVIAATGSGKTYLAAFDALNFDAKRVLFIVHRDTILKEAIKTFSKVFGEKVTYGLFMGSTKESDSDFIFSTNSTMSRYYNIFDKNEFDYIIIDEVHHAVASTYQKIINYFTPQFLLGLTATPERMDNESIFDLFEKNVPYELRIREALINDLIVPFKYYGINDKLVDYSEKDAKALINQIADDIHCEFVKDNIEKYRPNGKLKALGFCRTIEHAKLMAEKMNGLGYHTTYLTGSNDTGERLKAYHELQNELNQLEIIFTVDLLNEGVDIPAVNMVMFLRPTESSTIFIQQLGRGLRKFENKKSLIVLDFIGNSYTRSVQIALAMGSLSNNVSVDKRMLAEFIRNDFKQLDLPIEIHIDELSKEEILNAIENTNFNNKQFLVQDYLNFKKYLNSATPLKHIDFLHSDINFDLMRLVKKFSSYYNFLVDIKEDVPFFSEEQCDFIKFLSSFLPLVRPYEFLIIQALLNNDETYDGLKTMLSMQDEFDEVKFKHALDNLQNNFYSEKEREKLPFYISVKNDKFSLNIEITTSFKEHLNDLIEYGLNRFESEFYGCKNEIKLYHPYTRSSLLLALCNHTFASREGLIWHKENLYIFADLRKDVAKEEWLLYEDKFKSSKIFQWESQTETTLTNKKGQRLLDQKFVEVFVRKVKIEDGITLPYIYIGRGKLTNPRISKNIKKALLFDVVLEKEVPSYLKYDFEIPEGEIFEEEN